MMVISHPGGARPTPVTGSLDPPGLPAAVPAIMMTTRSALLRTAVDAGSGTGSRLRQPLGYTMGGA